MLLKKDQSPTPGLTPAIPMTPERVHQDHVRNEGTDEDYDVANVIPELSNDKLPRPSLLATGESLRANELYYDLDDHQRGAFMTAQDQQVRKSRRIIAKSATDTTTWDRLTRNTHPSETRR